MDQLNIYIYIPTNTTNLGSAFTPQWFLQKPWHCEAPIRPKITFLTASYSRIIREIVTEEDHLNLFNEILKTCVHFQAETIHSKQPRLDRFPSWLAKLYFLYYF